MRTRTRKTAIRGTGEELELAAGATMRLPLGRRAAIVRVARGTVLVTQEGDLDDHVLEAGDELALSGRGLAVAWAFTDAALSVGDAPRPAWTLRPAVSA